MIEPPIKKNSGQHNPSCLKPPENPYTASVH
jgi:hypothetical protein